MGRKIARLLPRNITHELGRATRLLQSEVDMGGEERVGYAPVHVLVADGHPGRAGRIAELLESGIPVVVQAPSGIPTGRPHAVLALGADDPLALVQHDLSSWSGDDRAVVLHGRGLRNWPVHVKARILLTLRCTLLDDSDAAFDREIVAIVGETAARLVRQRDEETEARQALATAGLVGESAALIQVGRSLLQAAALRGAAVLVTGETGSGKELVARGIHQLDRARRGPFVPVNCAALTATLAESELFGHRRGAYTGAEGSRAGLLRAASGGVIFLDEIGDLPLPLQAKLLRALQEQRVQPVGEDREVPIDVRPVSATNRELDRLIEQGEFRRDLYYRIAAFTIRLPALRERVEDIPQLVRHFGVKYQGAPVELESDARLALETLPWPGNVRELEQTVQRAIALRSTNRPLGLGDLPGEVLRAVSEPSRDTPSTGELDRLAALVCAGERNLVQALADCERAIVDGVLRHAGHNQTQAARYLGVSPRTIYNKVRRLQIPS